MTATAWAACALALLGVDITDAPNDVPSFDASVTSSGDGFNGGDLGVLLGAACYAAFTVRLGKWASTTGRRISRRREAGEQSTSVLLRVGAGGPGGVRRRRRRGMAQRRAVGSVLIAAGGVDAGLWAAVVYSAVGGALANLLQMKGQRIVPAAEAQVIFAGRFSTRRWASAF